MFQRTYLWKNLHIVLGIVRNKLYNSKDCSTKNLRKVVARHVYWCFPQASKQARGQESKLSSIIYEDI